ncbi:hypothetical protein C7M84_013023 [Penaeus vannamei]|uniref:Uncharacterized protein n=1 Tax=Penaeus vannamei TaxID=6689 RepID=A0A3R7M6Z1_PENVA|nr:hypothetical protein C7M84_013023 [Penaeus vannamei]
MILRRGGCVDLRSSVVPSRPSGRGLDTRDTESSRQMQHGRSEPTRFRYGGVGFEDQLRGSDDSIGTLPNDLDHGYVAVGPDSMQGSSALSASRDREWRALMEAR